MKAFSKTDPVLMLLVLACAALGAFVVWDAAFPNAILRGFGAVPMDFIKHLLGLALAAVAFLFIGRLKHERLRAVASIFFWVVLSLSVLVLIRGFGKDMGTGAYRWLGIGPLSFQPAELLKPATILFLALWGCKKLPDFGNRRKTLVDKLDSTFIPWLPRVFPLLAVLIAFVLVEKEPDLGTAVVILTIAFGMLLFGVGKALFGNYYRATICSMTILACAGMGYFALTKGYRADRLAAHSNRWDAAFVDGAGYQTDQAELAVAYGGVFGVGVGQGRAKHVLPAATTDFAPVTPFEEFGVFGSVVIISLLAGVSFRLLYLASFVEDPFRRLVVQGTGWWIGTQSIFNLLMAGAAIPAVGIPLPFFSYGNSSLLALGIALGACRSALAVRKRAEAKYASGRDRGWNRRPRLSRA